MHKSFFCPEPYRNPSPNTQGDWMPCCIASRNSKKFHNMNIMENKFLEFYNSDYIEKLKSDQKKGILSDEVKTTCKKCLVEENNLGTSRRLNQLKRYNKAEILGSKFKIDTLKIKHIGNLCNTKCVMCSPEVSSKLAQEHLELGLYNGPTIINQQPTLIYYEGLKEILPSTTTLKFVGGEPLINPMTWEFIDWLEQNKFFRLNLHFISNTRQSFTKQQKQQLSKFKKISISLSIDAYGDKNFYIRYPSKYEKALDNLNFFLKEGYTVDLYTCISLLNIGYLKELQDDIYKKIGSIEWNLGSNIVTNPSIFRPDILPNKIKTEYLNADNTFDHILKKDEDLNLFTKTLQYLTTLDKHRGTDVFSLWPEFKEFYEK